MTMAVQGPVCILLLTIVVVNGGMLDDMAGEPIRIAKLQAPELFMTAPERAAKDGYLLETHHTVTPDGYILELHRIPGENEATPVFFQHGLSSMSDAWLAPGRGRALAYLLADKGYDVWLGNARGNRYCKNHTTLKSTDPAFWKFSFDEIGAIDLPTMIDYVLTTTGHDQVILVGHSMGSTVGYVLLTARPEYNKKVRLFVSLSPPVFFKYLSSNVAHAIIKNRGLIKSYTDAIKNYELLPYTDAMMALLFYTCSNGMQFLPHCESALTDISGKTDGLDPNEISLAIAMAAAGLSVFSALHFIQLALSDKFQRYDFGPESSLLRYGTCKSPEYNLKLVTTPVAIYYGDSDALSTKKDVLRLASLLPNLVEQYRVQSKYFGHIDFFLHKRVVELLHKHVIKQIDEYQ